MSHLQFWFHLLLLIQLHVYFDHDQKDSCLTSTSILNVGLEEKFLMILGILGSQMKDLLGIGH